MAYNTKSIQTLSVKYETAKEYLAYKGMGMSSPDSNPSPKSQKDTLLSYTGRN